MGWGVDERLWQCAERAGAKRAAQRATVCVTDIRIQGVVVGEQLPGH
ncbi:hypothetical protein NOR51B_434 [Luminiphilus syltensis NOR5-1B]|uniref:Uncharacterized protein n=1 Tax=Luminiphilus syltensis NOR5-1B TaxID=565045 RepID=B8KUT3_9GAMM|nr:hypothetical protein NOR51B_434 [Luminiphilus syltensis NOR5-1B]